MKKIIRYFRWLLAYLFDLCNFDCKYRSNCKYYDTALCGHCDQCIFDMCGHCKNRANCKFYRRQIFARSENWEVVVNDKCS